MVHLELVAALQGVLVIVESTANESLRRSTLPVVAIAACMALPKRTVGKYICAARFNLRPKRIDATTILVQRASARLRQWFSLQQT